MRPLAVAIAAVALLAAVRALADPSSLARELETARHPPAMKDGPTAPIDAPRSETEKRLREDLACMCGSCRREAIATCKCDFAASMRAELVQQLAGHDLSTAAARQQAYDAVRAAFAAKYGDPVLRPHRDDPSGKHAGWLGPLAFGLGALWLAFVARRSIRRRRAAPSAAARDDAD